MCETFTKIRETWQKTLKIRLFSAKRQIRARRKIQVKSGFAKYKIGYADKPLFAKRFYFRFLRKIAHKSVKKYSEKGEL